MKKEKQRVSALIVFSLSFITGAMGAQAPTVGYPLHAATSGKISDLPSSDNSPSDTGAVPLHAVKPGKGSGKHDPAVQATLSPSNNFVQHLSFDGIPGGALTPPDPNMAVGPNHIVQIVNARWSVYDKAGNLYAGFPKTLASIWTNLGLPCAANAGDPIAQYDRLADRWFLSELGAFSKAPYSVCIAVSTTND